MQASAIQQLVYSRGFGKMAALEDYTRSNSSIPNLPPPPPAGAPTPLPLNNYNSSYPAYSISGNGTMGFSPPPVDIPEDLLMPMPEPRETGSLIPAASGGPTQPSIFEPPAEPEVSLMDGIKSLYHRAKNKYNSLSDNQRLGLGIGAGVLGGAGILGAMELYRKRQQEEEEHKMRMRAFRGY